MNSGDPRLRQVIAQALADLLDNTSAAEIARLCSIDRATPSRRGSDLHLWPASDLLALAIQSPDLALAIANYLAGEVPVVGSAASAVSALLEEIGEGAELTSKAIAAVQDGRVKKDEALDIMHSIVHRRQIEDSRLLPALRACVGG